MSVKEIINEELRSGKSGQHITGSWNWDSADCRFECCPNVSQILAISPELSTTPRVFARLARGEKFRILKAYLKANYTGEAIRLYVKTAAEGDGEKVLRITALFIRAASGESKSRLSGILEDVTPMVGQADYKAALLGAQIKTPMTIIRHNLDFLTQLFQRQYSGYPQRVLETTRKEFFRLESFIAQPRAVQGQFSDIPLRNLLSLNSLCREVLMRMRTLFPDYTFRYTSKGPEALILADQFSMTQATVSYLENAVRFSEQGGEIELLVDCSCDQVVVSIRDYGRGLQGLNGQNLFKKPTATDAAGSCPDRLGCGLHRVKAYLQEHGGKTEALDMKGKGAAFSYSLPLEPKYQQFLAWQSQHAASYA